MKKALCILTLIFPISSWACLEAPKSLSLSETSFEKDVGISYGVNCYVNVKISATSGISYSFSQKDYDQPDVLCLKIMKQRDYVNAKTYCGASLSALPKKDKDALTLRNKEGIAVGFIDVSGTEIKILSWKNGPTRDEPFIQFNAQDVASNWSIKAMQNSTVQVGEGTLKSDACNKSLGGDSNDGPILDMRNKVVTTDGAGGCHAGMSVREYKTGNVTKKTPVFKMGVQ